MIDLMRKDLRPFMACRCVVESVKDSKRLLAITQAVDPIYLEQLNRIDWLSRDWFPDSHWDWNFPRRILRDHCDLMNTIDRDLQSLVPVVNRFCNTTYSFVQSVWQICEPGFVCPMHTDGQKPNVMIIYWQTPGPEFGTTFYNSPDPTDVFHEFPGVPNTGFFAEYRPRPGNPWKLWHAALNTVPKGSYRLMTQCEFQK